MKAFLLLMVLFAWINFSLAQTAKHKISAKEDTLTLHMRDVVVTIDTTIEYNNPITGSNVADLVQINKGLRLTIIDNSFRLFYFDEYSDSDLNGIHMEFYLPSNMPKVKGYYFNGAKDGEWYYWNKQGILLRKELWRRGKFINKNVKK